MQKLISEPKIEFADIELVAAIMQHKLNEEEVNEAGAAVEKVLKGRVFEEIQKAIKKVVGNRDLPGQQDFWEDE